MRYLEFPETEIFVNKILDDGSVILTSYNAEYIKSEQFLEDIKNHKYPRYIEDELLECRILGVPFIGEMFG